MSIGRAIAGGLEFVIQNKRLSKVVDNINNDDVKQMRAIMYRSEAVQPKINA
jgi:hypothetical protein